MRTTRRPTRATRLLTDRAAGAAGGQGRSGHGGPGRATVSPPSAGRYRLSSPAAPTDSDNVRGFDVDLSPANAVSAS